MQSCCCAACSPSTATARRHGLAVADYMVERGDLDGALQWLRTPQADDSDGKLGFAVARLELRTWRPGGGACDARSRAAVASGASWKPG